MYEDVDAYTRLNETFFPRRVVFVTVSIVVIASAVKVVRPSM